jgi:hypothetical protein
MAVLACLCCPDLGLGLVIVTLIRNSLNSTNKWSPSSVSGEGEAGVERTGILDPLTKDILQL